MTPFIHGQKDRTTDRVDQSMYVMETLFSHACKTLSLINFPSIPLGDTSVDKYYTQQNFLTASYYVIYFEESACR